MKLKKLREIRVEGDIAYVPLTRGFEAIIDTEDTEKIGKYNWHTVGCINTGYYAVRSDFSNGKKTIWMHRYILSTPEDQQTDHIDCNGLNNRKSNLRSATKSQNQSNKRVRKDNTSGYKGVSWHNQNNNWRARIAVNGKSKHLGSFTTAELAYAAYCKAALELHGEFANLG